MVMSTTEHQMIGAQLYLGVPDAFRSKFMYSGQYLHTDFPATLMRVVRPCHRSLGFLRFVHSFHGIKLDYFSSEDATGDVIHVPVPTRRRVVVRLSVSGLAVVSW
jgi:hypothetical protein